MVVYVIIGVVGFAAGAGGILWAVCMFIRRQVNLGLVWKKESDLETTSIRTDLIPMAIPNPSLAIIGAIFPIKYQNQSKITLVFLCYAL